MQVWLSTYPTWNRISDLDKQECLPSEAFEGEGSFFTALSISGLKDMKEYSLFGGLEPMIAQRIFKEIQNPDTWNL